ncbi:MAG TPA: hypothetical protein VF339_18115 [Gammaproteobacteria bacterium]
MNILAIAMIVSCFLASYLARALKVLPVYVVVLPELLAGIALLIVLSRVVLGRRLSIDGRYLIFIGLLVLTMAMGIVAQRVPAGAVVSGLRDYVPVLPFLLLGAAYPFTSRQIKTQLVIIGLLLLIQVPIALHQRFIEFAHKMHTGDVVTGTTTNSGTLSVLMVAGVTVLTVMYLRRRLALMPLLVLTAFMLVPTMLNETKATLVMLPVAMLAPILFMRKSEKPFRRLMPLVAVFAVTGTAFIAVYNAMIQHRNPDASLQQFWFEGGVLDYVYKGSLEGDQRVGRVDSVQIALREISKTPIRAAFGLGVGNVSSAQLPGFEGTYAHYYDAYKIAFTQITMLLWNMGYMGLVVYGLLFYAIFRDAVLLARGAGSDAMLGQVWAPIVVIAAMCMFYKPILTNQEFIYPFMFYAGIVARRAHALRQERRAPRRGQAPAADGRWQPISALARH